MIVLPTSIARGNELVGRAVLPAATFASGPTSGAQLGTNAINGQSVPFLDHQPVQGFSAALSNNDGTFLVLCDNGYGALENSADFYLRVYRVRPHWKTAEGGSGEVEVLDFLQLRDPDKKVPFAITEHFTPDRFLTGADFDPESMQRAPDGSLWFGDEFGPFLLHTDATGKVLEAPIPLPDPEHPGAELRSPQNPYNEEASAVRVMNALRRHSQLRSNRNVPIFSPDDSLLDDGDAKTAIPSRVHPLEASGLSEASSEIFNVEQLHRAGFSVIPWTVNDPARMSVLLGLKVDGLISDRPDLLLAALRAYDQNGDGKPGDFLTPDGLIDPAKFDAQGHRGARDLRPENTLPSMEAALDHLVTTLEMDCGVTSDDVPVLSHDPYLSSLKVRRADGRAYREADEVLVRSVTAEELQSTYIADRLTRGAEQHNEPKLSPVSLSFFHLTEDDPRASTIYRIPRLGEVFDFVVAYQQYYTDGPGAAHPEAAKRAKNAGRVRFNIETKINPRSDSDDKNRLYALRTADVNTMVASILGSIVAHDLQERVSIESFDFRTLLRVQDLYPSVRTVALFGDSPKFANGLVTGSGDGTNLQPQGSTRSPWLAGLDWPYRVTRANAPTRVPSSGGFEGLALSTDGKTLFPMLEKPLTGDTTHKTYIFEFDLEKRQYSEKPYIYPFEPKGASACEFVMYSPHGGLVVERDGTSGDLNGFKAIYGITLPEAPGTVAKHLVADLLHIKDPRRISGEPIAGDVGIGEEFALPFITIESLLVIDPQTLAVINDNNFPSSVGRHVGTKQPDDSEFVLIRLERPLQE